MILILILAASTAAASADAAAPGHDEEVRAIQRQLNDPALAARMQAIAKALSKSVMDMPVGEIQAAAEGRAPTVADKRRTVRDISGLSERDLEKRIAQGEVAMQAGMKALAAALPAMMESLQKAEREMERAIANMPDPTYPKH